jgi:hypothetical protein
MSRWFRLYDEMLDDPKVQLLTPELFKAWVNILALASRGRGTLPQVEKIAFALRMSIHDAKMKLDELILLGLIDIRPDGSLTPHNWDKRQWASDDSLERVRRHRDKKRETFPGNEINRDSNGPGNAGMDVTCNAAVTVTVTAPDTDTDTEAEKKESKSAPKARTPRGARLANDWSPSEDLCQWTRTTFPQSTAESLQREVENFRDYWTSRPGSAACKLDWNATWRVWCRRAFAAGPMRPRAGSASSYSRSPPGGHRPGMQELADAYANLERLYS